MEDRIIKKTVDTPEVSMSFSKGELKFKGVCMPENPNLFFKGKSEFGFDAP